MSSTPATKRSAQDRNSSDPLRPLRRPGLVDAGALRVDRDGHRHIDDIELVDSLHAEVRETEHARALDGLGDEVSRTADSHQVDGLMLLDRLDGSSSALSLADHAQHASLLEHLWRELVHS